MFDLWVTNRIFNSLNGSQKRLNFCFACGAFCRRARHHDAGDVGNRVDACNVEAGRLPFCAHPDCDYNLWTGELRHFRKAREYNFAMDRNYDPGTASRSLALVRMGPEEHLNGAELS